MRGDTIKKCYVGARTQQEIEKMLKTTQFLLYYRRPDDNESLVTSAPLMVGYKYSSGIIRHFHVLHETRVSPIHPSITRTVWRVDVPGGNDNEYFDTLDALMEFLDTYAYILPHLDVFKPL